MAFYKKNQGIFFFLEQENLNAFRELPTRTHFQAVMGTRGRETAACLVLKRPPAARDAANCYYYFYPL